MRRCRSSHNSNAMLQTYIISSPSKRYDPTKNESSPALPSVISARSTVSSFPLECTGRYSFQHNGPVGGPCRSPMNETTCVMADGSFPWSQEEATRKFGKSTANTNYEPRGNSIHQLWYRKEANLLWHIWDIGCKVHLTCDQELPDKGLDEGGS